MPITFTYNQEANFIHEVGQGKLTVDDFVGFREKVRQLPLRDGLQVLADFSDAEVCMSFLDMERVKSLAQEIADSFGRVRVAICAADDPGYGMARMYGSMSQSQNFEVEVFRSLEPARQWLNL